MSTSKKQIERTRCEVYSRVVGYLSPVGRWNAAKGEEWKKRKTYHVTEEPPG